MKKRILVFPCGSEIGLEIHRSLMWSTHCELFGATSVPSNHGKYVYKNYLENVPFIDDPEFKTQFNLLIDYYKIDFIFPAHDSVVLALAENRGDLHCKIIGSPAETCRTCRSKRTTYQKLKSAVESPHIYELPEKVMSFPVFLKPDVGQGSKGTVLVQSKEEIDFYVKKDPALIVSEYIPGPEYTVDCFTDRHGKLRFVGARERIRISNGISSNTMPVVDDRLNQMAEIINKVLEFRGVWFFQVKKRADDSPALLEIAPRIAGSMGLYRNLGINFPLLSFFDAMDSDIEIVENKFPLEMDRALINRFRSDLKYRHVYMDLDDTVILNGKVNVLVIAFLYQCISNDIKVHLLSRHDGDIAATLRKYRLEAAFDTITVVGCDERKADFINEPDSIFIDDSFSERRSVHEKLGIPTFDTGCIESLLDWRA